MATKNAPAMLKGHFGRTGDSPSRRRQQYKPVGQAGKYRCNNPENDKACAKSNCPLVQPLILGVGRSFDQRTAKIQPSQNQIRPS